MNLKELRQKANKTQANIADYLGISYQAYAHYESGRREPDNQTLKKLGDYFNVSVDYLLGRSTLQLEPLSNSQIQLLNDFDKLSTENKSKLLAYAKGLSDAN